MNFLNNKGKTLIEALLVLIILGVISSIAYPLLFMNEKNTTNQLDQSAKRNDIRNIENFLKKDLRTSVSFETGAPADDYLYKINFPSSTSIEYIKNTQDDGTTFITREINTEVIGFNDITNIELTNNRNTKLIEAKIYSTDGNGDEYLHETKISRWEWKIDKGEETYYDFIKEKGLFVQSGTLGISNGGVSLSNLSGKPSTILIKKEFLPKAGSFSIKGPNLKVYVEGDLDLKNNHVFENVELYVQGNVTFKKNTEFSGVVYSSGTITKIPTGVEHYENYEIDIPKISTPKVREEQWYSTNGYSDNYNNLSDKSKIYVSEDNLSITANGSEEVVIVNKTGNINLSGNKKTLSGLIYAPNGSVEIGNQTTFTGTIITKEKVEMQAHSEMIFGDISEFLSEEEYPFLNESNQK